MLASNNGDSQNSQENTTNAASSRRKLNRDNDRSVDEDISLFKEAESQVGVCGLIETVERGSLIEKGYIQNCEKGSSGPFDLGIRERHCMGWFWLNNTFRYYVISFIRSCQTWRWESLILQRVVPFCSFHRRSERLSKAGERFHLCECVSVYRHSKYFSDYSVLLYKFLCGSPYFRFIHILCVGDESVHVFSTKWFLAK